jgi:hypothetical protein
MIINRKGRMNLIYQIICIKEIYLTQSKILIFLIDIILQIKKYYNYNKSNQAINLNKQERMRTKILIY